MKCFRNDVEKPAERRENRFEVVTAAPGGFLGFFGHFKQ